MADNTDMLGVDDTRITQTNVMSNSLRAVNMAAGQLANTNLPNRARANTVIVATPTTRDYGDYTDIQKALNAVHSAGGGTVYVKPGTYFINQALTIYANTVLEGLTNVQCVFNFNKTAFNLSVHASDRDVTIRNITFKNCSNSTTGAIYINNNTRVEVVNCIFNSNATDIYSTKPFVNRVRDCVADSGTTFYSSDDSSSFNEVVNCQISNYTGNIFVGGTTGNGGGLTIYRGNSINNLGAKLFSGVYNFVVIDSNNVLSITATPDPTIDISNSTKMRIVNNRLDSAIKFTNSGSSVIANNYIYTRTASTSAIQLTSTSNANAISGNNITSFSDGSSFDGIKLSGSSVQNVMTGNWISMFSTGTSYAVNISDAGSTGNTVVGNFLAANTADTQNLGGASNIIASNA